MFGMPVRNLNNHFRRSWKIKGLLILILIPVYLLIVFGCAKKEAKVVEEKVINVRVSQISTQSIKPYIESIGTLQPFDEVVVSSESDGILKKLSVDEGSSVFKGMLLAELNDTDYRLDTERAEAALRQANASYENTKQEYKRKEALYKEELVTKQQFDDVSARLVLAGGEVDRAKVGLSLSKERLVKTKVYAPLSGVIKGKRVSPGNYIRNGTPLLSIVQTDPIKLIFSVTEKDIGLLKVGQEVLFIVDTYPERQFKGRLNRIYSTLDERTRTLQVEALTPNPQKLLKPGFFAKVTLYTGPARDMILIPITAILYDNAYTKVFLVEDNRAKEMKVKIGDKYGDTVEVVEGLKAGQQVVVVGQNSLIGGIKVNVAR